MEVLLDMSNKTDEVGVPVSFASSKSSSNKKTVIYPCLCKGLSRLLIFTRWTGVLPLAISNRMQHSRCTFHVPKKWIVYSIFLQCLYSTYFCYAYGYRLVVGPPDINRSEWYVMTFGYMVSDLDSIVNVIVGTIVAKRVATILAKISTIPGYITEMKLLQNHVKIVMRGFFSTFILVLLSYTYVFFRRIERADHNNLVSSDILDSWLCVLLRGFTVFFPTLQAITISALYSTIWRKFEHLADTIKITIAKLSNLYRRNKSATLFVVSEMQSVGSSQDFSDELDGLSQTHQEIYHVLDELNRCMGVQLLFAVTSSLYTSIYYCYRYATTTDNNYSFSSHETERIHYVIGLIYRMTKMFVYMGIGQRIYSKSLEPLSVIQESKLVNLPPQIQQQLQTLLLQWQGRAGYLSAFGVINLGPWYLPPIIGNVITYLLVALQFNDSEKRAANVTALLESVF